MSAFIILYQFSGSGIQRKVTGNYFRDHYLNYESEKYIDYPSSIIFTSIYSGIAAIYDERVAVFQESSPKSLDLNYWNYVVNKRWLHKGAVLGLLSLWMDRGEFITWGYIPASDFVGYEVRDYDKSISAKRRMTSQSYTKVPILYAFYRQSFKGEDYVAAVSGGMINGSKSDCIVRDSDGHFVHCVMNHVDQDPMANLPKPTTEAARVLGIFSLCQTSYETCSIPNELVRQFPTKGGESLPVEYTRLASNLSVNGKRVKFFPLH